MFSFFLSAIALRFLYFLDFKLYLLFFIFFIQIAQFSISCFWFRGGSYFLFARVFFPFPPKADMDNNGPAHSRSASSNALYSVLYCWHYGLGLLVGVAVHLISAPILAQDALLKKSFFPNLFPLFIYSFKIEFRW